MTRRFLAVLVGLTLSGLGPARADFQAGVAAYDRGDYRRAFDEWLPLAEKDDLAAQRNIGQMYRLGRGVPRDFAKAAKWYGRAAERGLASAQVNLGVLYLRGDGVPKDEAEAARWFEQAAKAGSVIAQYHLGMMYEAGLGVKRNPAIAMAWYYVAARRGEPQALQRLANLLPFDPLHPPPSGGVLPEFAGLVPPLPCGPVPAEAPKPAPPALAPTTRAALAPAEDAMPRGAASPSPGLAPPSPPPNGTLLPALPISPSGVAAPKFAMPMAPAVPNVGPLAPAAPSTGAPTAFQPLAPVPAQLAPQAPGNPTPLPAWNTNALSPAPPPAPSAHPATLGFAAGQAAYAAGDYAGALRAWLPEAEAGNAEAQFQVAELYLQGRGVPADSRKGYSWLSAAARQGHPQARQRLRSWNGTPAIEASETPRRTWRFPPENTRPAP